MNEFVLISLVIALWIWIILGILEVVDDIKNFIGEWNDKNFFKKFFRL